MKTNETLQRDVQNAIKWEPLLEAAEIGVTAKDGVVTLTGTVDTYSKKCEAEDATKNVLGVKAVVEKININFHSSMDKKNDGDIANEVLNAYKWNWEIPSQKVKVRVENGWVTLEGEVAWNYQRQAAARVIKNLDGVMGVHNNMTVRSESHDAIEQKQIESALQRNWSINDEDIDVKVAGTKVTLSGMVNSWYQKDEAGRIAWNAPGVWEVENDLVISYN